VPVGQVEFIIMGGTFMSMAETYRSHFVAQLHNALSGFTGSDVVYSLLCETQYSKDISYLGTG
jgi:histone acetyltransferase (RNA polymerase elongator complex component)